jgi:hypothetical protein
LSPPNTRRRRVALTALRPEVRHRLGRALATWTALTLAAVVILGALVVWHLVRRGRLLRERLGPPRKVDLPDWAQQPPKGESS